jgi:hypothetical protein
MGGTFEPGPTLMPGDAAFYEVLAQDFASSEFEAMTRGALPKGHFFKKIHPFANLLPMLPVPEREALRASLADGQIHPVILFSGQIADGRNRARELIELRKPIRTEIFHGTHAELLKYLKAENIDRRHLSFEQRLDYATRVARIPVGANQHTMGSSRELPSLPLSDPNETPATTGLLQMEGPAQTVMTQGQAAEEYGVSVASIKRYNTVLDKGVPELAGAVQQGEIKVAVAEKIAKLPEAEQPAALEKALPNGNRAIMSSRQEPDDSLDFFPTPPWATRALIERVIQSADVGIVDAPLAEYTLWEPACGEGHMAEVLREYTSDVLATDVFDYGYGDATLDFTSDLEAGAHADRDFIVTNPPFGAKSEEFVLQALRLARVGVAMFVRLQWLETVGRYERIFKDNPPTLIAFFAERVNLCKGRWDPEGGTATAYIWLVWIKGEAPRAPFWIAPGCREAFTRPDDAVRFTQRPVARLTEQPSLGIEASEAAE